MAWEPSYPEHACEWCGGAPTLLGQLGSRLWVRCRDCGWDWTCNGTDNETEDD